MDLNDPMWLLAAHVSFRLVSGQGRFGWGRFNIPPQLAAQRHQLLAGELLPRGGQGRGSTGAVAESFSALSAEGPRLL
jgi:hypothetical protein